MAFDNATKRAQFLIDRHKSETGLEGDGETILTHILADLLEWSDANRVDFDLQVESAREMLLETS
jgi:hypothetical protein